MLIQDDFVPKRNKNNSLPPGQYETLDFPVLSLGVTPEIKESEYLLKIEGLVEKEISLSLSGLKEIENEDIVSDIHCVTKWSKLATKWRGVSMDSIMHFAKVSLDATHLVAYSEDGYSTNIPIEDIKDKRAHVVYEYEGQPIMGVHGGPVRLLVPHLYFWKSAKWLSRLKFIDHDEPGFWETRGYHNYGDPWKEQRYTND